jgi:CheY-like chemotaxis protein
VQGALPQWVRADEKRVRQIFFNLLGNAVKFTATGGVTLRLRYAREMAQVDIVDTGPGMSALELERIFEPFTRGDSAGSGGSGTGTSGSGLGLTIAKMLTDLMGGELHATSVQGQGSVFRVRLFLPELHLNSDTLRGAPKARKERKGYAGVRRKILVVDNEEADRDLLANLLTPLGFEVRVAASGYDALDLLAAGLQPDAVLMDLAMPGIDGWETLRRMRALGVQGAGATHAVGVAIVSANAFDRGLDNDLGIAPEDFIVKPVRHSELLDWLERKLALVWQDTAPVRVAPPKPTLRGAPQGPPLAELHALQTLVRLGFYRGIVNQLEVLSTTHPECAEFSANMAALARQFQFEPMQTQLQSLIDAAPHA